MKPYQVGILVAIALATFLEFPPSGGHSALPTIISPTVDWLILIAAVGPGLYALRAMRLARDGIVHFTSNLLVAVVAFLVCKSVLSSAHIQEGSAIVLSYIAFALSYYLCAERANVRSRYIPVAVRRKVIARDLKEEQYDPAKHHIDHRWPFARGGSHTEDNLRVIPKVENLKKGSKRPRMSDMW
jgi:hypothetical protein